MRIVLWDTRRLDVAKDFAGGFGVGQYDSGGGVRGWIVRRFYQRDHRPVALNFAYLAAILKKLGHTVEYALDHVPLGADLYVFNPSLITLGLERQAIGEALAQAHRPKVLVVGILAHALPQAFDGLEVTLVKGEPEQLLWKLDEVLSATQRTVEVGSVRDLDSLPFPDWRPFAPQKFKIVYDFSRYPTGLIQQSRGCTFTCNYCPYIVVENATRFRSPESVFDELAHGIKTYGFRSFKFRDPLFGLDRKRVLRLVELIERLPKKVQFSIESRIDLLRPETLKALRRVGLVSITVGIETPDEGTLRHYKRAPVKDDKQRQFTAVCRALGIRTVAGFMIGFPEDTEKSIRGVLRYAKLVNPTFANFNIVTPYPGTEFFEQVKHQIANFDFTKYNVYTPVMKYQHLSTEDVRRLHAKCFTSYYFRTAYLRDNAHLLWPWLAAFGVGRRHRAAISDAAHEAAHSAPPKPMGGLDILQNAKGLRHDGPHAAAHSSESVGTKNEGP